MSPISISQQAPADPDVAPAQAAPAMVPFTRASSQYTEGPIYDESIQIDGSVHKFPLAHIPAFGFLRNVVALVEFTGGSGGAAVAEADAPHSAFASGVFRDVSGTNVVGSMGGFQLGLVNKWGAYQGFDTLPANSPAFSALDADGNGSFLIRVPLEIIARYGLGAISNQNAGATYKLELSAAASGDIFSTPPVTTLPVMRVRLYNEIWTPPEEVNSLGQMQETRPPGSGTWQYWTEHTQNVVSGDNTIQLPRTGNYIRTLIFVWRQAGVRTETDMPESWSIEWDKRPLFQMHDLVLQDKMRRAFGFDPDVGVRVLSYTDELTGHAGGGDLLDRYLLTGRGSRVEVKASFGGAGTLEILTNDVAPSGDIFSLIG